MSGPEPQAQTRALLAWPIAGLVLAIGITTTMDATGLSMFSALALTPLLGLLWLLQRFTRAQVGLVWGQARDYGLAILYPILVLGLVLLIAWLAGATASGTRSPTPSLARAP
jgi:hypothetical protein